MTSQKNKICAEWIGTFLLIMTVVGSGIMGENLSQGNSAVALLANSIATGCSLYVLISALGPLSGAHFNPVVSIYFFLKKELGLKDLFQFLGAQFSAGLCAVFVTHFIFEIPILQMSEKIRTGPAQWLSEMIATFGLLFTIVSFVRFQKNSVATGVALYITAAYWFTSSTSFANPAVTLARSFTNTFSGISLDNAPAFVAAQLLGLGCFYFYDRWQS